MTHLPDRDTWRKLIGPALRIVDSLRHNGYGELDFRLGGGTVLMFRFDHRISGDIDLFTNDAQALGYISPRLNDVAAYGILDYQEQANALKLLLPDGDIDVIVAGSVTRAPPSETINVDGRLVALEATAEILAKKLLYRADTFKARDVFDMSVALALDCQAALHALRATERTRPALLKRLAALAKAPQAALTKDIILTEAGEPYAENMVAKLLQAVSRLDEAAGA